jgi:hypothetical protein
MVSFDRRERKSAWVQISEREGLWRMDSHDRYMVRVCKSGASKQGLPRSRQQYQISLCSTYSQKNGQ